MKYLEKYIEEKMRIKVLGELTTRECSEGDDVGVSLVIDGYEPGIEIWYVDYANWLEEKIENSHYKNLFSDSNYKNMFSGCEKPISNSQEEVELLKEYDKITVDLIRTHYHYIVFDKDTPITIFHVSSEDKKDTINFLTSSSFTSFGSILI